MSGAANTLSEIKNILIVTATGTGSWILNNNNRENDKQEKQQKSKQEVRCEVSYKNNCSHHAAPQPKSAEKLHEAKTTEFKNKLLRLFFY